MAVVHAKTNEVVMALDANRIDEREAAHRIYLGFDQKLFHAINYDAILPSARKVGATSWRTILTNIIMPVSPHFPAVLLRHYVYQVGRVHSTMLTEVPKILIAPDMAILPKCR